MEVLAWIRPNLKFTLDGEYTEKKFGKRFTPSERAAIE